MDIGVSARAMEWPLRSAPDGEPYRPSDDVEAALFRECYCDHCRRADDVEDGLGPACAIFIRGVGCDPSDPGYPDEWIYGDDGWPTCSAFVPLGIPMDMMESRR